MIVFCCVLPASNKARDDEDDLRNGKAYELLSCCADGERRHVSPSRSKVKVARSRGPSDRCWPIIIRERQVSETPKLVHRLRTPCEITSFKVKRSKVKDTRPINAKTEIVSHLPN